MDKTDWTYILAIVALVLVTILGLFDKLSAEDIVRIFLLVIGAGIGVATGYGIGYALGYKRGAAVV